VMTIIEQKLGLRAGADTLSTTWFGRTTLTNVRLGLPLSDQPFVKIPVVTVHHRWLTGLAITRDIGLRSIELDHPTLWVRRDALGRWNLQDVVEMIVNALGPSGVSSAASSPAIPLPAIKIVGATIEVSDASGRNVSIGPVDVIGTPRSAVAWKFTVTIPGHVAIDGVLAPGGSWRQELDLSAHGIRPWIAPWFDRLPANTQLTAHWAGQLIDTPNGLSLAGLLLLHNLSAAALHAGGTADASIGPDAITVNPRDLSLFTPNKLLPRADIIGGSVTLANDNVAVQNLALQLMGGPAKLNASYNLDAGIGQLSAAWDRLTLPGGVVHSGSLTAALTRPFPLELRVDTSIDASGSAPGGPFTAKGNLSAAGSDWTNFDWQAQASTLLWQRVHPLDLSGLRATGKMRGMALSLDSIGRPADAALAGYGWYDFSLASWAVNIAGETWPFHPAEGITFSFHLDADGDRRWVHLHDFSLRPSKDGELVVDGSYDYSIPKPVSLHMRVRNFPDPAHPSVLGGKLDGSAHLTGTIWPRKLDVVGELQGTDLALGPHHLGTIALRVTGTVDNELADIQTEHLALLGGQGDVEGIYSFSGNALDVGLTMRDLSLAQAGRLIGREDCSGTVGGHWHLFLPGLSLNPDRIRFTGLIQANDAAVGNLVSADQIDAQTTLEHGALRMQPITMLNGKTGRGSGDVAIDLNNVHELRGSLTLTDWPVEFPRADGKLSVDLNAPNVVVDLPTASTDFGITVSRLELQATAMLQDKPAGHVQIVASSSGRIADLEQMHVSLLDGAMDGQAHLDLDQFSRSTAQINWQKLDTAAIARFVPALTGLSGRITGTCVLEPASGVLALEPIALHIRSSWSEGRYKTVVLRNLTVNGFLNHTPQYSRIVLADDPSQQSQLAMAGGTVTFWARCGIEPTGEQNRPFGSFLAQVGFNQVSFNQLLHVVLPASPQTPGLLSGNFMLLGNSPPAITPTTVKPVIRTSPDNFDIFAAPAPTTAPAHHQNKHSPAHPAAEPDLISRPALASFLNRFYGEAHANLTDSDLINVGPFQVLYNLMHVSFGSSASKPTGYGDVDVRFESGNLSVTNLRYFNRGTEIDALATISNVANLPDSKLSGSAIGSLRPLSQIKLPFFSDVDTLLAILQQGLTSVTLGGTVRDYKVQAALFKDLGGEMKNYLLGNAENNGGQ
jgi:hypothetical protein